MEQKKTFEISEDAVVAIRTALGRLPHDQVNQVIVFFEKSLVLKKEDAPKAAIPTIPVTN